MLLTSYVRDLEYAFSRAIRGVCQIVYKLCNSPNFKLISLAFLVLSFDCLRVNLSSANTPEGPFLDYLMGALFVWIRSLNLITVLELFGIIVLVYLVAVFVRYAKIASTSVAIDEFRDCRKKTPPQNSKDPAPVVVEDLNDRLVAELDRICTLYRNVAKSMYVTANLPGTQPRPPHIDVEKPRIIQAASQGSNPLALGPVSIPQDLIRDIGSSFVRGVRIVGLLSEENGRLQLIVHRVGSEEQLSWTVTEPETTVNSAQSTESALGEMIRELACKMFTSMEVKGAFEWKAVRAFNQGLEEYLRSKGKPQDRIVALRRAEEKFIEALSEDKNYYKAYYNLGVIYYELGKRQAAEKAFISSIQSSPEDPLSFYALALNYFQEAYVLLSREGGGKENDHRREQLQQVYLNLCRVIELCDACLKLKPFYPEAYELKGFAYRLKDYTSEECPEIDMGCSPNIALSEMGGGDDLDNAIQCRRTAVKQSWRSLCWGFVWDFIQLWLMKRGTLPRSLLEQKDQAYKYLNNLAYTLQLKSLKQKSRLKTVEPGVANPVDVWSDRPSSWLLSRIQIKMYQQALALKPSKTNPHLGIGVVHLSAGRPDLAVRSFEDAISLTYHLPSAWMYLALAHSRSIGKCLQRPGAEDRVGVPGTKGSALDREHEIYTQKYNYALRQVLNYIEEDQLFYLLQIVKKYQAVPEYKDVITLVKKALEFLESVREYEKSDSPDLPSICFSWDEIPHLKPLFGDWATGELHRIQGSFLLKCGESDQQPDQEFQSSLKCLKPMYLERIRRNSIYASLALAHIQRKDYPESIRTAGDALSINPRCSHAHLRRGQGFCGINDLDQCIKEYTIALQCDSKQPEVYFRIGQVNLLRAQRSQILTEKRRLLSDASDNFKKALRFHEGGSKDYAKLHCWLGKISLSMGSYNEARAFFEIAGSTDVTSIKTAFHLGETFLGLKMFAISSLHFKSVIDNFHENPYLLEVEEFLEDGVCIGALMARCYIRNAVVTMCLSHDIKTAESQLDAADPFIRKISNAATCHEVRSESLCAKGWLLLRGKRYTEAVETLQKAHGWGFTAQSYWYMARAHCELGRQAFTPQRRDEQFTQAKRCCGTVKALDVTGHYSGRAEQMLSELENVQ